MDKQQIDEIMFLLNDNLRENIFKLKIINKIKDALSQPKETKEAEELREDWVKFCEYETQADIAKIDEDRIFDWFLTHLQTQSKESEWISVEDRLPTEYCQCLIYCPQSFPKNCRVLSANYYDDNKLFYCDAFEIAHEDVTHWQPLPKPPIK